MINFLNSFYRKRYTLPFIGQNSTNVFLSYVYNMFSRCMNKVHHSTEESQMIASIARMFAGDKNPPYIRGSHLRDQAREKGSIHRLSVTSATTGRSLLEFWLSSQRAIASEKSAYLTVYRRPTAATVPLFKT